MSEGLGMDADEAKVAMRHTVETFRKTTAEIVEKVQWAVEVLPSRSYEQYSRESHLGWFLPKPPEYGDTHEYTAKAWEKYYEVEEQYRTMPFKRTVEELDPENLTPEFVAWAQTHSREDRQQKIEGSRAPQPSWTDQWRERWNVNAPQRALQRLSRSATISHAQEQEYGEGYGR